MEQVDLLGFSMGGLAVNLVALNAPTLVWELIIAGSRRSIPSVYFLPGIVWPQEQDDPQFVQQLASASSLQEGQAAVKRTPFPATPAGERAFHEYWESLQGRTAEPAHLELMPMHTGGEKQIAAILDADKPNPRAHLIGWASWKFLS